MFTPSKHAKFVLDFRMWHAELGGAEAARVARVVVQDGALGNSRSHVLGWLLACLGDSAQVLMHMSLSLAKGLTLLHLVPTLQL